MMFSIGYFIILTFILVMNTPMYGSIVPINEKSFIKIQRSSFVLLFSCHVDTTVFKWTNSLDERDFAIIYMDGCSQKNEILKISPGRFILRVQNSNSSGGTVSRADLWKKALVFMMTAFRKEFFKYLWIFEEDIFLLSADSFLKIHQKATEMQADFISSQNIENATWQSPTNFSSSSFYRGSIGVLGINEKVVNNVKNSIDLLNVFHEQYNYEFFEYFFHTLMRQHQLISYSPSEFETLDLKEPWTCSTLVEKGLQNLYRIENQASFVKDCILNSKWDMEVAIHLI
jgi:hypothetical protein